MWTNYMILNGAPVFIRAYDRGAPNGIAELDNEEILMFNQRPVNWLNLLQVSANDTRTLEQLLEA